MAEFIEMYVMLQQIKLLLYQRNRYPVFAANGLSNYQIVCIRSTFIVSHHTATPHWTHPFVRSGSDIWKRLAMHTHTHTRAQPLAWAREYALKRIHTARIHAETWRSSTHRRFVSAETRPLNVDTQPLSKMPPFCMWWIPSRMPCLASYFIVCLSALKEASNSFVHRRKLRKKKYRTFANIATNRRKK